MMRSVRSAGRGWSRVELGLLDLEALEGFVDVVRGRLDSAEARTRARVESSRRARSSCESRSARVWIGRGGLTGALASRSVCVGWFFVLPSGFRSRVVSVLCRAANCGFATSVWLSTGGIIVDFEDSMVLPL
jgi:hypothetical protein